MPACRRLSVHLLRPSAPRTLLHEFGQDQHGFFLFALSPYQAEVLSQRPAHREALQEMRQVYHAELVLAAGTVFHTCCYTCRQCRKPLETTTVYEAENEIFCKQCYVKRFGPIGYGYGLGAGTLQTP